MSFKNDDILPESYKYSWSPNSDLQLQDYLTKFKPSMVQNDGTKPWIWVHGPAPSKTSTCIEEAREEASKLLKELTEKVEEIKNDTSIPVRSNKKTGAKSKKEVREQVQAEATDRLRTIAIKHGYVCGKWLIFAPADKVDMIWSSITTSLVSGPLSATDAYSTKVSTSSKDESSRGQHLICVYIPDVYDKVKVTEVMKVLLRSHGATLSGVKSDLYTTIGIDSKHPSGIPSTIWKNSAILSDEEAKGLKEAYFTDSTAKKSASPTNAPGKASAGQEPDSEAARLVKGATKLKLKKADADPFKDEVDEDNHGEATKTIKPVVKVKAKRMLKKKNDDPFGSDENELEKNKAFVSVAVNAKRAQPDEGEDEGRPAKKHAV